MVEKCPEGLRISFPVGHRRGIILATSAMVIWLLGEIAALYYLARIYPFEARLGTVFFPPCGWLAIWTVIGLLGGLGLLWQLRGQSVVQVGDGDIRLSRTILGLGPTWTYAARSARGLRTEHELGFQTYLADRRRTAYGPVELPTCCLAFDYGVRVVRFGTRLAPAEAERLLALILEHFPRYGG